MLSRAGRVGARWMQFNARRRGARGFTLIELMIVVAILGILSAIAIPAFSKYVRRSKTTEALMNLRKLFDGSVAYFERDHSSRLGAALAKQFPAPADGGAAWGPSGGMNPCCDANGSYKCDPGRYPGGWGWTNPVWQALSFAVDDPHYYWYGYQSAGPGGAVNGQQIIASFTAIAMGNLNCAGGYSRFERVGAATAQGVHGGAGVFAMNPLD